MGLGPRHQEEKADDCLLLSNGENLPSALRNLELLRNKFTVIAKDLKLNSNPVKSKLIVFNRARRHTIQLTTNLHYYQKLLESTLNKEIVQPLTNLNSNLHPQNGVKIFRSLTRSKTE